MTELALLGFAFMVLAGFAFVGVIIAEKKGWLPAKDDKPSRTVADERFAAANEPLLTAAEARFLVVLEKALYDDLVNARVRLATQVSLAQLITPEAGLERGEKLRHRNKIDRKSVDFVVADSEWKPMVAIELDDRSHERGDRRRRDADVERWLRQAGVRLVRVPVRREYDVAEVRGLVAAAVRGEG